MLEPDVCAFSGGTYFSLLSFLSAAERYWRQQRTGGRLSVHVTAPSRAIHLRESTTFLELYLSSPTPIYTPVRGKWLYSDTCNHGYYSCEG